MKSFVALTLFLVFHTLTIWGQLPHQQTYSSPNTPHECGSDDLMEQVFRLYPDLRVRQEVVDFQNQEAVYVRGLPESSGTVYTIPVVVHVVHRTGIAVGTDENITDAQIQQAIVDLNDAFRNRGYYNSNTGADVEIEFCLATRDPQGRPTNGITRTVNDLYADLNMDTEDHAMKTAIAAWSTLDYCNIWLVREICSNGGCGTAGYAYLASAHGLFFDGIVNEARFFGSSPSNSTVHVHEMGHYLNLYHTFYNGCANNDCRTQGDKICDTPPDNLTNPVSCNATVNTCTTDDDDLSLNNPFRPIAQGGLGDQYDMIQNYMDYGYQICKDRFTLGQKAWMQGTLTITRASLLLSDGCQQGCTSWAAIDTPDSTTVVLGSSVSLSSRQNYATTYRWMVNNVLQHNGTNFTWTPSAPGTYAVTLVVSDSLCTDTSQMDFVVFPTGTTVTTTSICNNTLYTLPSGSSVVTSGTYIDTLLNQQGSDSIIITHLTVHDTRPIASFFTTDSLLFIQGGSISFTNISGSSSSYQWLVNDTVLHTGKHWSWTPTISSVYTIQLLASDGICVDTSTAITVTVLPSNTVVIDTAICTSDPYVLPSGRVIFNAGRYIDTATTSPGINSVSLVYLSLLPTPVVYNTVRVMVGDTHVLPDGRVVSQPRVYYSTLQSSNGCDSTIVTTLDTISYCRDNFVVDELFVGRLIGNINGFCQGSIYDMVSDSAGNTYVVGKSYCPVDIDNSSQTYVLTHAGQGADVFIAKYDFSGRLVWAHQWQPNNHGLSFYQAWHHYRPLSMAIDGNGDIYLAGHFARVVDFDFGTNTHQVNGVGRESGYILKMNSNGQFIWVKTIMGTPSSSVATSGFVVDAVGNCYLSGRFRDSVDFDPSMATQYRSGGGASFTLKLDANGDYEWVDLIEGTTTIADIQVDPAGNVYSFGTYSDTVDFDPSTGVFPLIAADVQSSFLRKIDAQGTLVWAKSPDHIGRSSAMRLVYRNNALYASIYYEGRIDVDLGRGRDWINTRGCCIIKTDANGNSIWGRQTVGSGWLTSQLAVSNNGEVYYINNQHYAAEIGQLDANGRNTASSLLLGQAVGRRLLFSDDEQYLYVAGEYRDLSPLPIPPTDAMLDFSQNGETFFMLRHRISPSQHSYTTKEACEPYYWRGAMRDTTGRYQDTVATTLGCDSIYVLDLNVDSFYSNIDIAHTKCHGSCDGSMVLNASTINNTYSWSHDSSFTQPYITARLCPGTYVTTITNPITGCSVIDTSIIEEPTPLLINITTVRNCTNRSPDIVVQATGGWGGYRYAINNGAYQSSNVFSVRTARTYTIRVIDSRGCVETHLYTVPPYPASPIVTTQVITNCGGIQWRGNYYDASGFYRDTASSCDTIHELYFNYSPIRSTVTLNSCNGVYWRGQYYTQPGLYRDTSRTQGGCDTIITMVFSITPLPLSVQHNSSYGSFHVSCHDACDGSASIQNPDSNYVYHWSNGTLGVFNDSLCAGTYTVTVTNATGCMSTRSITLQGPPPVGVSSTTTPVSCAGLSNGQIVLQGTGGVNFYEYSIDGGATFVWPQQFYNLSAGTYYVQARDFNGCIGGDTITVGIQPPSTTTTDTACAPYPWRGQTLTTSGIYTDTTTDANGCDSILTLDLTIVICTDVVTLSQDALDFDVYPIPNKGQFFLRSQAIKAVEELILYNVLGQAVPIRYMRESDTQIQVKVATAVLEGAYVLRIRVGERYYTKLVEIMP